VRVLSSQDHVPRCLNGAGQLLVLLRVRLRLGEQDIERDEPGLACGQFSDQLGMQASWPGPGEPEFIEGVLVDADEDERKLRGEGSAELKASIQALEFQNV